MLKAEDIYNAYRQAMKEKHAYAPMPRWKYVRPRVKKVWEITARNLNQANIPEPDQNQNQKHAYTVQSKCRECGWLGPVRSSDELARDDGNKHTCS